MIKYNLNKSNNRDHTMAEIKTLKNAALKDKQPGSWDIEVCHEGEADLYKHYASCWKHPDHKEFIPVDKFDITYLPKDYQDEDILEYIQLVAQLTVRLTVRYVSPDRPATVPGTDTPYPGFQHKGTHVMTVGTGLITDVFVEFDWLSKLTRFKLEITTAAHVVYDNQEAQHTTCHLFFDDGSRPEVCSTTVELDTLTVLVVNTLTDECALDVHIPDSNVIQAMTQKLYRLLQLKNIIRDKLTKMTGLGQKHPLTFIVSHPHGCSKKISIGRCVEVDDNLDDVRFLYTTPTCPGSSGASVVCLDDSWYLDSIHCGTWMSDTALNIGSCRYHRASHVMDRLFRDTSGVRYRAHWHDFRLTDPSLPWSSLPPEYRYNLVMDYISAWSHFIVRVDVEYVSEQRPEFWPGSEIPYPWYEKKGSRQLRSGNGWVDRVDIFPTKSSLKVPCDCVYCKDSSTPESQFAHIYIQTSTSLVFDQSEGNTTSCFTSRGKINPAALCLRRLSSTQPVCGDVETDRSQLVFVTHDLMLAERLKNLLGYVALLKEKVHEKLSKQQPEHPITIIIDSFNVLKICRDNEESNQDVCTTPGQDSVGAPFLVLGDKNFQCEVRGHVGQYPHDPSRGYRRYSQIQKK